MLNRTIRSFFTALMLIWLLIVAWPLFLAALLFLAIGWIWIVFKIKKQAQVVQWHVEPNREQLTSPDIIDAEFTEKENHD